MLIVTRVGESESRIFYESCQNQLIVQCGTRAIFIHLMLTLIVPLFIL